MFPPPNGENPISEVVDGLMDVTTAFEWENPINGGSRGRLRVE